MQYIDNLRRMPCLHFQSRRISWASKGQAE
jgi:hypothetical protein